MTAASVLGVPITPARAAACREIVGLPAALVSGASWEELRPLVEAAAEIDAQPARGPEGAILTKAPFTIRALASCALGTSCARCVTPIEDAGEDLADGWCCSACVARQRATEAFRRHAALWMRRGNQMGLFGVEPATARRRRK